MGTGNWITQHPGVGNFLLWPAGTPDLPSGLHFTVQIVTTVSRVFRQDTDIWRLDSSYIFLYQRLQRESFRSIIPVRTLIAGLVSTVTRRM